MKYGNGNSESIWDFKGCNPFLALLDPMEFSIQRDSQPETPIGTQERPYLAERSFKHYSLSGKPLNFYLGVVACKASSILELDERSIWRHFFEFSWEETRVSYWFPKVSQAFPPTATLWMRCWIEKNRSLRQRRRVWRLPTRLGDWTIFDDEWKCKTRI